MKIWGPRRRRLLCTTVLTAIFLCLFSGMVLASSDEGPKGWVATDNYRVMNFAVLFIGLFLLLRSAGPLLAAWSLAGRITAGLLSVLGAVFLMNSAEIASRPAYSVLADNADRLLINGLQATSNYTSFHLSLVLSSFTLAGFFWLFLRSGRIPKPIAGWGLFASLFVAITIVLRDFFSALGHIAITMAFMLSNLIALFSTSIYLAVRGVRAT